MKGSVFAKTLPRFATPKREKMILDAVRRRDMPPIEWVPIKTEITSPGGNKYTAKIMVSKDAVRVGDATDSFRVSVDHGTAQHIADELDTVLPTPYLSDQIWNQSVVRPPTLRQSRPKWMDEGTASATHRMVEQSKYIDKLIAKEKAKTGLDGLIADVGKDWVTHPDLWLPYTPSKHCSKGQPRAMNYGWHYRGKTHSPSNLHGVRVIQPAARCHIIPYTDYSQVVRLVRRDVEVCGLGYSGGCGKIDIRQIASSPDIHGLVSAAGPLEAMRHPDVPPSCKKRCPPSIQPAPTGDPYENGSNGSGEQPAGPAPPEVGPLSCPVDCDDLPEPEPDPTTAYLQASLSPMDKAVMLGAGTVLGFLAVRFLLPRL
jgi:hypothetical protein